jgi:hypothetical protein
MDVSYSPNGNSIAGPKQTEPRTVERCSSTDKPLRVDFAEQVAIEPSLETEDGISAESSLWGGSTAAQEEEQMETSSIWQQKAVLSCGKHARRADSLS